MITPPDPFAQSSTTRGRWLAEIASELLPRFEQLTIELNLVARARAEGVENRPGSDEQELDAAQRDTGAAIGEKINLLRQFLRDQLHRGKELILARFPARVESQISMLEARAAVKEVKLTHTGHLVGMFRELRRKQRQLDKFRADNGPLPDARYAPHWIIPLAVLFSMTAAEMAANAGLFAKASAMGFVGGAFQAFLFGVVNVAVGFCAGLLGVRFIHHTTALYRVLGFAVLGITLTAGTYWNIKVAAYRDALAHNADAKFINLSTMTPSLNWLSLSTIESWALLLLGLVVFVLAMLEGRGGKASFSDPYPGHRAVDLAFREAESEYITLKNAYRAAVRAAIGNIKELLRQRLLSDSVRTVEIVEIADAALVRTQEVRDSIGEWIALGCSLLRLYRQENENIRTAPAPAYFRCYPSFNQISDGVPDASDLQSLANEAEQRHLENGIAFAQADADLAKLAIDEAERFLAEIDAIEEQVEAHFETERNSRDRRPQGVSAPPQFRRAS